MKEFTIHIAATVGAITVVEAETEDEAKEQAKKDFEKAFPETRNHVVTVETTKGV